MQTLVRYHNYSAEFKQNRINSLKFVHYSIIILLPISLISLMSYGMSKVINENNGDIELIKIIILLNYFLAIFNAILVLVFVFAGVLLLLTLKKFSH